MAEDWLDCPVLGPGWKRRESFRKSGVTCGRSDTYYQSPTGERIRSKVELTRFLGPDCDLSCFDFKRGVLQYLPAKASPQKKKTQAWPKKAASSLKEKQPQEPRLTPPAPQGALDIWCENCGAHISGDSAGRRRLRSLCKSCRAQRNAFNREQRMFKRVGCGDCAACRVTEDCGVCSACAMQLPQLPRSQCVQRRCLKIINKSFSCGLCSGCQTKEDCGTCRICERKGKPGLKRQWKCLQRRCLKKRIMTRPRGLAARKLPGRWRRGLVPPPAAQAVSPSSTAKDRPPSKLPRSQVQCLTRLPTVVTAQGWQRGVTAAATAHDIGRKTREPKRGQGSPAPSKLRYSSRRQSRRCGVCAACRRCVDCGQCDFCQDKPKFGGCNQKRQKCRWRQCLKFAMGANRAQRQHSLKQEEEEAAKANTPVIMEIYSLSGATPAAAGPCGGLDSVLREFLAELNELPLPAHWEVLPPRGPDLRLIQRSPLSTMAAAVIHIQPGLYFHVVVQDVPVPPSHELYSAHPLRLTTVDEVVELICNLEAYHLCPGWPGSWRQGPRSPDCAVLVYEGRCQACCLKPCTSGSNSS
uniref:Methyl-CpG-binding domain protein 1 n=1 Tax=Phascolarctos cinereus TaxID=38626 RepID=A0A6P5JFE2_PHACI|nr:methyl-CpG-binding domain protein 1-like isoform X11 [Phascolarctos cinereus]